MPGKHSMFKLRSGNKPSPLEFFQGDVSEGKMYNPENMSDKNVDTEYMADDMRSDIQKRMYVKPEQGLNRQKLSQDYVNEESMEKFDMQAVPKELTRRLTSSDAIAAMQANNEVTNQGFEIKRKRNPGYLNSNL